MRVHAWILGAAILAAPLVVVALGSAPATPSPTEPAAPAELAVNVDAPRPSMSTEELLAMRNTLAARVAVYDAVEQTWRAPTPSEQAELSEGLPAAGAPTVVSLANGGTALKGDAAALSFVTVELQPDGTFTMGHVAGDDAASVATMGGQDVE